MVQFSYKSILLYQSVPYGFLCSPEYSKVCFELLKILRAAQNALPLQEAEFSSEVGKPSKATVLFLRFRWSSIIL